ncbi:hypothetical protein AAFF_G00198400 [Aldrovandia affinis]|uniref:ADF-H domain-containing protein n=1 Tax=Aldrovandia affinis TaxID=143900 RepID=A0AAD7RIA8_9TELE|nr:hypothetical protein AAFF_G00198400 [Aldrovandia affinis]
MCPGQKSWRADHHSSVQSSLRSLYNRTMASGITVHESVEKLVQQMKVHRHGGTEDRLKLLMLRVSDDLQNVIVDEDLTLYVKDVADEENVFKKVMSMFPKTECRFGLYDCSYRTNETMKEDLIFFYWAPDEAKTKSKMVYTSTSQGLKTKIMGGVKYKVEAQDLVDLEVSEIAELLGKGSVLQLEGIPIAGQAKK